LHLPNWNNVKWDHPWFKSRCALLPTHHHHHKHRHHR
jgi:hypothetical protein